MLDQANEVQEALGRTYGMPEMDDADLDAGIKETTMKIARKIPFFSLFHFLYTKGREIHCYFRAF